MKEILKKCFENGVSMTIRPERDSGYLTFDLRKGDYFTRFGFSYDELCDSKVDKNWLLERHIDGFLLEYKRLAEPVNVEGIGRKYDSNNLRRR